jgi:hypothetical protein
MTRTFADGTPQGLYPHQRTGRALIGIFRDAGFARIEKVVLPLPDRRIVGHEHVGTYLKGAVSSFPGEERIVSRRRRDVRVGVEDAKHRYGLEKHFPISLVNVPASGQGGVGMRNKGSDPYHVKSQIAA